LLLAGPGEAVIEIQHAQICGTDLAILHGEQPIFLPNVCGHEFTRKVKSVENGANKDWIGKKVTAKIY